ncbi:MAG: DUF1552 domain-containing protein [Myxococcota bacterium]
MMKFRSPRFDRRTFLQAAGLGAGASALTLPSGLGFADSDGTCPKRLVLFVTELGWNTIDVRMAPEGAPAEVLDRSNFHPTYSQQPDDRTWELDLTTMPADRWSSVLAPLAPLAHKATVLDGLGMLSIAADPLADGHGKAINHALSGHPASRAIDAARAIGGAPSIDQRIARFLREQNPGLTDLTAMTYAIRADWREGGVRGYHWWWHDQDETGEYVRIPNITSPQVVFDRMFSGGGPETEDDGSLARRRRVLNSLTERYGATFPNLGRRDRDRLDQHRQRLSDIDQRLARLEMLSCDAPTLPGEPLGNDPDTWLSNLDLFFELTTIAFTCGLSRIASFQTVNQDIVNQRFFGASTRDFHEAYSHGADPTRHWYGQDNGRTSQADHERWLEAAPVISNKNRFHLQQVVRFAETLDQIPEGDGTVLDNTLIVMVDELAAGSHIHDQWPVVMLGNLDGAFRTGRYIRLPRTNPRPDGINAMGPWVGQPHNPLLISICQAMGMDSLESLGIDHIDAGGQRISLTGRLPELY